MYRAEVSNLFLTKTNISCEISDVIIEVCENSGSVVRSMAIVIQHNLSAVNTNRQLGKVMEITAKSTEKLSGGYRINRAADDASGLSISEKMRRQIRGLQRAAKNIQDGISLCQVADGALNETHSILHRMNELSIQAANDTNKPEDRAAIQNEIDAMLEELDRIADTTTFNENIYPLHGGSVNSITLSSPLSGDLTIEEYTQKSVFHYSQRPGINITSDGVSYKPGETFYVTGLRLKDSNTMWMEDQLMEVIDKNGNPIEAKHGNIYKTAYNSLRLSDLKVDANGYIYYTLKPDSSCLNPNDRWHIDSAPAGWDGKLYLIVNTSPSGKKEVGLQPYPSHSYQTGSVYTEPGASGHYSDSGYTYEYLKGSLPSGGSSASGSSKLWIQMGADSGNGMFLFLVDATADGIGLSKGSVNVSDYENAGKAMEQIKNAIETVSSYRSQFGAQQNRLEHGMAIDKNIAENTQDAESRIRDLDMADEMVIHAKNNILAQMGQAMLAQTNRRAQDILALLQ